MDSRVAVVTDSTASLPAWLVEASGVVVVPLHVVIDGTAYLEGVDLSPAALVDALRAGSHVSTAQPGPEAFARVYARVAARGAREIVSIHLSGKLSSTATSAELAAQSAGVPVRVVDSGTVGMALGLAVLAAAGEASGGDLTGGPGPRAAPDVGAAPGARGEAGSVGPSGTRSRGARGTAATAAAAARAAERRAAGSSLLFAVDSLEHLRRGGRLSALSAALGTVLGLRPVLGVRGGRLEVVEKARTGARARDRVVEMSVRDAVERARCDVVVHHLGEPEEADRVAEVLRARCGAALRTVHVAEISAAVGAHVGPGLLAVVVADV